MEIINYVGTAPTSRRLRRVQIPVSMRSNIKKQPTRLSLTYSRNNISFPKFPSGKVLVKIISRHLWIIPIIAVCTVIPFTVKNILSYTESYSKPLPLANVPASELEILDKAMSQFALDTADGYDDNGNVLNADGSVVKQTERAFRKTVSYHTYIVKSGDTISGITRSAGLTNISTLIAVNDIDNVRQLHAGQKLQVPSADGLTYTVRKGDTLAGLSVKYNVTVEDLLDVNDISSQILPVGKVLFIPGARLDSKSLRSAMGDMFKCPLYVSWRLTSPFGWRPDPFTGARSFHTGIDMAVAQGTPIYAAMSGTVAVVGYSNIFGNYVIINHGNGYQTLYAHMVKTLAHKGQWVSQGTRIGLVGTTGYSTGPHLHFTVYKNGKLINPLTVLK